MAGMMDKLTVMGLKYRAGSEGRKIRGDVLDMLNL